MVEGNFLVGSIQFLDKIGVYDVVLPFLLVFVIMYAILEKTKVFGTEKAEDGKTDVPRKNLNSMAAFVIGFLVIASSSLVASISAFVSQLVLLIVLSVAFLILVGSFTNEKNMDGFLSGKENKTMRTVLMVIMFIGILVIFLNSMQAQNGTWLEVVFQYLSNHTNSSVVGSILLLAIMGGVIYFMTKGDGDSNSGGED
ncbi:hypothetical protein KY321_00015 [Candidatus Woesearchaeota archaeon]|nr:hypothetical protein [Candidatus Woesearchaeota archaeon]